MCAAEGIAFVLGHALAMKAIHGGKANDKVDSFKIATLLRAVFCPRTTCIPRACDRPETCCVAGSICCGNGASCSRTFKTRAPNIRCPNSADASPIPPREGVSEHFPDPIVRKSIDVDLALLERDDGLITDLELTIVREAKQHDGDAFHRLARCPASGRSSR